MAWLNLWFNASVSSIVAALSLIYWVNFWTYIFQSTDWYFSKNICRVPNNFCLEVMILIHGYCSLLYLFASWSSHFCCHNFITITYRLSIYSFMFFKYLITWHKDFSSNTYFMISFDIFHQGSPVSFGIFNFHLLYLLKFWTQHSYSKLLNSIFTNFEAYHLLEYLYTFLSPVCPAHLFHLFHLTFHSHCIEGISVFILLCPTWISWLATVKGLNLLNYLPQGLSYLGINPTYISFTPSHSHIVMHMIFEVSCLFWVQYKLMLSTYAMK